MNSLLKLIFDLRRGSRFSIFSVYAKLSFYDEDMDTLLHGEQTSRITVGRTSLFITAGLVFWLVTFLLLLVFSATPPVAMFEQAWRALGAARRAEANVYAGSDLRAAERAWEQATRVWSQENDKWFFRRNFQRAFELAKTATWKAQRAESVAVATKDSLRFATVARLAFVTQKVDEFKTQFNHVPVAAPLRKRFIAGELLMLESEFAFNRRDFWQSHRKVRQAEQLVGSAGEDATKFLRTYLKRVPDWQSWVEETIAWSEQQNATAIIVDKMAHRCQVYVAGKKQAEYAVELGPRWLGHKRQKGDNATPEGHYYVTKKKSLRHTKYYKALEINYPNENDREQFLAAKARGELPRLAQIGGLIEIHGDGGKGVNWTSGCVALRNQDIDKVFELADIGTRVTIVGSLKAEPSFAQSMHNLPNRMLNGAN